MADSKFLPEEVLVEILSKLPLKSQLRFRCVGKSWHGMISDPEFVLSNRQRIALPHCIDLPRRLGHGYKHELLLLRFDGRRNRRWSIFDVDNRWCRNDPQLREFVSKSRLLMTFKGLLLLRGGISCNIIYLLNPMIRRLKKVFTQDFDTKVIGICCTGTDDYKILLSTGWESTEKDVIVRVGSFKTKTWKDVPFPYSFDINGYDDVLFVHERIHLFFNDRRFPKEAPPLLISFDANKDEFVEVLIPVPKGLRYEKGSRICGLGVLNGELAMSMSPRDSQVTDIWVIKGQGANESWTILFTLEWKHIGSDELKPLGFTEDGELLIKASGHLMLYNPKNDSYRNALVKPLEGMLGTIGHDVITFEGNVFFPSHLTEFQLSKKAQRKRKRSHS